MKIYKVGGCVRDALLGKEHSDTDFVIVGSNTAKMLALGFRQVGKSFPVFLHPKTNEEYALARVERKTADGYYGFETQTDDVSLEEDLLRRDLTINAIAMDENSNIIDPYNGASDIKNKILRPVSIAFKEDALRVIRVTRFYAVLGSEWHIHDEIFQYAQECKNELRLISKERIYLETKKAFATKKPSLFFIALKILGVLDVVYPEIAEMINVFQNSKYHKEDVFTHTMMALDLCENDAQKFAILFHDIAKPYCQKTDGNMHMHCDKITLEPFLQKIKKSYALTKYEYDLTRWFAINHLRFGMLLQGLLKNKTVLDLLLSIKTKEMLTDIIKGSLADMNGRISDTKTNIVQLDKIPKIYEELKLLKIECSGLRVEQIKNRLRHARIRIVATYYADIEK
ncbi:MAG: tRNA nucleotidyl transferase [Pseudomonadota bacterium]